MAGWRCPHCGSPQIESSRCWVCRRSTTTCASCRYFRTAVAGRLGYCAIDKRRAPLSGEEERACWERSAAEAMELAGAVSGGATGSTPPSGGQGLWGTPIQTEVPPDRSADGHGMWTESDLVRDPEAARHQYAGSIRTKPWGDRPGSLREATGWRRGIRRASRSIRG